MVSPQIEQAIEILRRGGVVAFPTDTVYGLGANALSPEAIRRVFQVKKRPLNLPLSLLLADISQITQVCSSVPDIAMFLAQKFLPGGLTLVLPKASHIPSILTANSPKLGVRVPDHPIPLELIKGLGVPITGTSANLSGQPSPLTPEGVKEQLGTELDFIIEGICPGGRESTVIDLTGEPKILREGIIPKREIERAIKEFHESGGRL